MTASPTDLSIADAEWFRQPQLHAVFAALNRDGHEARIVGGALRNTLMALPVGDIDFAVTAMPDDVMRFAEEAGLKPVPTGIDHGTITIVADHRPFEVTTLRQDVETHGRRATVAFTSDWATDAARRDFTINAFYADSAGRIYDPLGGLPDLQARRVRFIGSANERIREDYLRILRFFRFTADYSAAPADLEGVAACICERGGLASLSAERVRAELMRILVTRNPRIALDPMAETGILTSLLGGVVRLAHFIRMSEIETDLALQPVPVRRLAALAVMVEEDADRLSARLRLSNLETGRLETMAALEPAIQAGLDERRARELLYRLNEDAYRDRVLIAWSRAETNGQDDRWEALFSLPDRWEPPRFPLKGKDLIAAGMEPGAEVGQKLRELEERWIASDFTLNREELLQIIGRKG